MSGARWAPLLVALGGCNLIVGASDFSTDTGDGGAIDGAVVDGATVDGAIVDAAIDAQGVDADPCVTPSTVFDVHQDCVAVGTPVSLSGVVVTAIDGYGNRAGLLWVQDPGGGAFRGILVFDPALDDVALLAVGDIVDITGAVKEEFALGADTTGRTETELISPDGEISVTKVASGPAPVPTMIDAAALAAMSPEDAALEHEKWEGVLITMVQVRAAAAPIQVGNTDPTFQSFPVTGGFNVQSALAAFPSGIVAQTCFERITGIGGYFFEYLVMPRATDELAVGAGCP